MARVNVAPAYPYRFGERGFRVRIEGGFAEGGLVELFYKDHLIARWDLPPVPWGVIALLARAALNGTGPATFLKGPKLARLLTDLGVIVGPSRKSVNQAVHAFRELVDETKLDWPAGLPMKNVREDLLQTSNRGYRLSMAPEQIELIILDDQKKTA